MGLRVGSNASNYRGGVDNQGHLTVNIGGKTFEVYDGDTLYELDEGGGRISKGLRVQGIQSRETQKINPETGQVDFGEVGGQTDKHITWKYLTDNADKLSFEDLGLQTVGRGAGDRSEIDFVNKETGESLSTQMAYEGLTRVTGWEDQADKDARDTGEWQRSVQYGETYDPLSGTYIDTTGTGGDKYQGLRGVLNETRIRDDEYLPFKGVAFDEKYFDKDFHTGVEFRTRGTKLEGGYTTDNVGTAWDVGWANVTSDYGAFMNSLGVAFNSQGLQDYGNTVRIRNNFRAESAAPFEVSNLEDIDTDEGFLEFMSDSVDWLAVNSTMSIPYMTAIAGAGVAAAATGPLSGTAILAAAPGFAIHAGTIWNDLDPENRTKENLPKVYGAGLANTVLDVAGLGGAIQGAKFFTKEGFELAAKQYAQKHGVTEEVAKKNLKNITKAEVGKFAQHNADVAEEMLKRHKLLTATMGRIAKSAPLEAMTEVGQEVNAYLTAQHINGDPVDDRELMNIVLNSAAAGFAIGGTIGGVSGASQAAQANALRNKWTKDYDPDANNAYLAAIEVEEDSYGIPDDERSVLHDLDRLREASKDSKVTAGYTANLAQKGLKSNVVSDLVKVDEFTGLQLPTVSEVGSRIAKSAARLTKAASRNEISPEDMKNPFLRTLYKTVDFMGGGGRNFEGYQDFLEGTFSNIASSKDALASLNLAATPGNARMVTGVVNGLKDAGMLRKAREAGFDLNKLSESDRAKFDNLTGNLNSQASMKILMKLNNSVDAMYQAELNSLIKEYGKNSPEVKAFQSKKVDDYYANATSIDRVKAMKDPKELQRYIKEAIKKKLSDPNVSAEDKKRIKEIDPEDLVDRIINEGETDVFSMVEGIKSGGSGRLLDLSELEGFTEKFGDENIFADVNRLSRDTAKRVAHMEYFGDGGRMLDYIMDGAIEHEIEANGLTEEQAIHKVSRIAADYKDIIDSKSNNYRRIKNKKVAKAQRFLLSYTSFVALALAGAASVPEWGTAFLTMRSDKGFMSYMGDAFKKSFKPLVMRTFEAPIGHFEELVNKTTGETKRSMVLQDEMFNQLHQIGVPVELSDVYNKWGMEGSEPISNWAQQLQSAFFTATLVDPITYSQRVFNGGLALDFIRDKLDILMLHEPGTPFKQAQGEAYYDLKSLGMNVDGVLKILKDRGQPASELNYDTKIGTSFQNEINSVTDIQDRANQNGLTYEEQLANDILSKNASYDRNDELFLNDQIGTVMQNFINTNIQNPGSANRPLLFQDPRLALITQFNGFISTVTTTLVPKLWNDRVMAGVRTKNPNLTLEGFKFIVLMFMLGALGQYLKDLAKGNEEDLNPFTHPYYDFDDLIKRAFMSSGIIGQFEKPLNWILPQPFNRDENIGIRAGSDLLGPNIRHGENIMNAIKKGVTGSEETGPSGGVYEVKPDASKGLNELLKSVPVTSTWSNLRHDVAGIDTSKWRN